MSAVLVGAAPSAAPVRAAADTVVTIDGRGYGHGYGLSQWGAYGYAVDHGWTSAQILNHYYGGTVAGTVPLDSVITVRLQNLDDAQTAVVSESGGLVVDGVAGGPWKSVLAREVSPSVYSLWARTDAQVCPAASGNPVSSGWTLVSGSVATQVNIRTQADTTIAAFPSLPAVCEPGGKVKSYRGFIRAVNGTAGENRTVNIVPLEHYLRSVIAKEMSPSWATAGGGKGAQALQAQAVAARSYALAENKYSYAKTCDLVCQYYMGAATRNSVGGAYTQVEYPGTDAAVLATAGVVRRVGTTSG
ncbi:MAG: SpoIID/LytB domain-containing protein, partial [Actinomycetota bacterium]|nr:SpoIID/LytB domain-containing protein [Actinomycetota bacterium]